MRLSTLLPIATLALAPIACRHAAPETRVNAALAHYAALATAMQHDSIAALFLPDGAMQNAGDAPIVGPDAIRTHLRSFADFHVIENRLHADSTRVHGDSAYQAGTFWQRVRLPKGDTVIASGRFEAHWALDAHDHAWKLHRLATR